jgi:hypothetical protein
MSAKKIKTFYCYPDMRGLGAYYADNLNNKYIRKVPRRFIQGEVKRMAVVNHLVAEVLLKRRPRKSWVKELETHILGQIFSEKELNSMSKEQKRSALARLLFPKE